MAKEKGNTIETLEQALEVIAQKDNLIAEKENQIAELEGKIAELEATVAEKDAEIIKIQSETTNLTKEVPGTYKSKKHKVTVRFRKGFVNTRYKGGIIPSSELIKNEDGKYTEFLDHLIEIGFGGFQKVK